MNSCPIRDANYNASIKRNGEYQTYYSFNKYGMLLTSPAWIANDFDKDHFIMPGVTDFYKEHPDYKEAGERTWYSKYISSQGYSSILYFDPKFSSEYEYGDCIFFEDYKEGRIPFAVNFENPYNTSTNTDSLDDDINSAIEVADQYNFGCVRFCNKLVGDSNILFYPGERKELGLENELEDFKQFCYDKWLEHKNDQTQWSISDLTTEKVNLEDVADNIETREVYNAKVGKEFADKISKQLGIDYQIISEAEAKKMLGNDFKDTAFFSKGTVYFIEGKLTPESIFHEFCHPFVRALRLENKTLFDKIYNDFISNENGKSLLEEVKSKYNYENENYYKEELMVYALQQAAGEAGMLDVHEIIYGIKNQMRKNFGKSIKISKLDQNTSLLDLAKMLQTGGQISFDGAAVSYDEVVMYFKRELVDPLSESLTKFHDSQTNANIIDIVDNFYKASRFALLKASQENYKDALPDYIKGKFEEIVRYIKPYSSEYIGYRDVENADIAAKQASAVANALVVFDEIISNVASNVKASKLKGSDEKLLTANHYNRLTENWKKTLQDMDDSAKEEGIGRDNPLREFLIRNLGKIDDIKSDINKNFADCVSDTLEETLTPMIKNLEQEHEERLQYLIDHNAPQWRIDQEYTEFYGMSKDKYDRYTSLKNRNDLNAQEQTELRNLSLMASKGIHLDKDMIKKFMQGELGDVKLIDSMLSSYLTNNDPIIGGFALYLKNGINESLAKMQDKMVAYCNTIKPLLDKIGYNPNQAEKLRDLICFKDKIAVFNRDTNKLEEKEVWSFMHEFKNWRLERAKKEQELRDAQIEYRRPITEGTDQEKKEKKKQARKKYFDTKWEFDKWNRKYFNQEYVSEFYKKFEVFDRGENDEIGKEAYTRMQAIFEEMNMESDGDYTWKGRLNAYNTTMDHLWREYSQLSSFFNIDGTEKTGRELEIAKRIKEYKDKNREFYFTELNEKKLQSYYEGYLEEMEEEFLLNHGIKEKIIINERGLPEENPDYSRLKNSPEYHEFRNRTIEEFQKTYFRTKISDEFFNKRQRLLDRIDQILDTIPAHLASKRYNLDISAKWKEIIQITSGFRDNMNEINAEEIKPSARYKIKELEEEIAELRRNLVNASGLTRAEQEEYFTLENDYRNFRFYDGDPQMDRFRELQDKINQGSGLTPELTDELRDIYAELQGLSTRKLTMHYITKFNNTIGSISSESIKDTLMRNFGKTSDFNENEIRSILDNSLLCEELMADNEEFQKFFTYEHKLKTRYIRGNEVYSYEPIYCWVQVMPSDDVYLENYVLELKEEDGTIKDRIPLKGMPCNEFYTRRVKEKYKTNVQIGINKDNQGKWLPKTKEQMDAEYPGMSNEEKYLFVNTEYEDLKNSNPAAYELLEKMKSFHLAFQEGTGFNERLYFDVPRFTQNNLERTKENITGLVTEPKNLLQRWAKRVKEWIWGAAQDSGDVVNYNTQNNIQRADLFADDITEIRIDGLQDIDIINQSANIISNELRFMASAEKHKQLVAMSPVADALKQTLQDEKNKVKDLTAIDKTSFLMGFIKRLASKGGNNREQMIDILINREFKGERNDSYSNNPFLNKAINFLEGKASFAFFAFNPISSLKNAVGMKYNYVIDGVMGKWVNMIDLAKGNDWAAKAVAEYSVNAFNRGSKPLKCQIAEIFDFNQDKFYNDMGKNMYKTVASDVAEGNIFYNFRKLTELQAIYEYGAGILHHEKITVTDENGNKSVIPYLDAFELDENNHIKLKDGIDVRYSQHPTYIKITDITSLEELAKKYHIDDVSVLESALKHKVGLDPTDHGYLEKFREEYNNALTEFEKNCEKIRTKYQGNTETIEASIRQLKEKFDKKVEEKFTIKIDNTKFKDLKNRVHGLENHAGGAYASFDQPALQRNFLFRIIYYLKRYFPGMADRRFGMSNIKGIFQTDETGKMHIDLGQMHGRRNYLLNTTNAGYYSDTLKFIAQRMMHLNNGAFTAVTPQERYAIFRTITDIAMWFSMMFVINYIFDFDDDDEDKYKKLRRKSGALPTPFTSKDAKRNFNAMGWAELQALNLMLQIQTENSQFQIIDPKAFKNYTSVFDLSPYFLGPTVEAYGKILDNLLPNGAPGRELYSRTVGPYIWQEKDTRKAWNYFLKTFGITGSVVDPLLGIQNQVSFAQKATNR